MRYIEAAAGLYDPRKHLKREGLTTGHNELSGGEHERWRLGEYLPSPCLFL